MTAYIAYIASLCHGRFKATQYSFLTSMMGFSRSVLPAISGYIVSTIGWKTFYLFASIATIPSIILVLYFCTNDLNFSAIATPTHVLWQIILLVT